MWLHGLAAFALLVGGHPALAALAIAPALLMADVPFNVLRVLWRLRRVRRAMRPKHDCARSPAHWAKRVDGDGAVVFVRAKCLDCGRAWAEATATATATTFPRLAAYRELARTGDVEAFAAKDLRPVTRFVRAPPEDAFEIDVESGEEPRRGRAG